MPLTPSNLKKFLSNYFVESGTGHGDGVQCALDTGFPNIRSIELGKDLYDKAVSRFGNNNKVMLFNGASEDNLWRMIFDIDEPATFWLDGHYCGPGFAQGRQICPLMDELLIIGRHHIKNHTILIDDVGCWGKELPGVSMEGLQKAVLSINPEYTFSRVDTFMVCTAPSLPKTRLPRLSKMQVDNIYPYLETLLPQIKNPVVFEVGAADGTDTERIVKINKNVRYFAFEPDVRNIEAFKSRKIDNVRLVESAVGAHNGIAMLYMSSGTNPTYGYEHTLSSSIKKPKDHLNIFPWCKFNKYANVNICTLDTFCMNNMISNIDVLWSDIQGAEIDLLKGASRVLSKIGYLYLEYSDRQLYDGQASFDKLIEAIGPKFEVIHKFSGDVLLRNKDRT